MAGGTEDLGAAVHARRCAPKLLCAHVVAERDAAGEQVEDLARVVRVGVQPLVQLGARVVVCVGVDLLNDTSALYSDDIRHS